MTNRQMVPRWQQALAIVVGISIATNLAIYRVVGSSRHIFNPAERSGYELGSGMGMGIGITLVLWMLILRRAPRRASLVAFILISAAGWFAVHFAGMRR